MARAALRNQGKRNAGVGSFSTEPADFRLLVDLRLLPKVAERR
jgi:hypothetical protein